MTTIPERKHAGQNSIDRKIGEYWEGVFCAMESHRRDVWLTPLQIGHAGAARAGRLKSGNWNYWLLPDVTIWSAPTEHHEIKHKRPTRFGSYGLERYRLEPLVAFARETKHKVFYTIHDWESSGAMSGSEIRPNRVEDWWCADVTELARHDEDRWLNRSYRNGQPEDQVEIVYWPARKYFHPLADVLPEIPF